MRYFNIAGPCNITKHYMIDASTRLKGVEQLIDDEQYFLIHAARQSGKTTYLHDLTIRLNAGGKYYALHCSLEAVQNIVDPKDGIPAVISCIKDSFPNFDIPYSDTFARNADLTDYVSVLKAELARICKLLDRPLVILFDEVDCLSEDTLIMFLRQLRDGYNNRIFRPFVHSIALVGMRNIRDYKARVRDDKDSVGSASPFNIITKTYTLQNFTKEEIIQLYSQHTGETGQIFEDDAIELVWEQTQGQPWLVNAIAREAIVEILQSDYTKPVTAELVDQAIQTIILRRDTHIDSLLERLNDDRVRKIIEPMILGDGDIDKQSDDFQYTKDLGLICVENSRVKPANPIYAEVIIRRLSFRVQDELQDPSYPYAMPSYLKDGRIDMDSLMHDFQQFWRKNSEFWLKRLDYIEAVPHLVLMGFLQRVVNGGGKVTREVSSGTGRLDLCIEYENRQYPIELKIRHSDKYVEDGVKKTARYMDTLGCNEGWMVVFDRRTTLNWEDKIYTKKETINGKTITVIGA